MRTPPLSRYDYEGCQNGTLSTTPSAMTPSCSVLYLKPLIFTEIKYDNKRSGYEVQAIKMLHFYAYNVSHRIDLRLKYTFTLSLRVANKHSFPLLFIGQSVHDLLYITNYLQTIAYVL